MHTSRAYGDLPIAALGRQRDYADAAVGSAVEACVAVVLVVVVGAVVGIVSWPD
jgi:hypothetical protein